MEFADPSLVTNAMLLDNTVLRGRTIKVRQLVFDFFLFCCVCVAHFAVICYLLWRVVIYLSFFFINEFLMFYYTDRLLQSALIFPDLLEEEVLEVVVPVGGVDFMVTVHILVRPSEVDEQGRYVRLI